MRLTRLHFFVAVLIAGFVVFGAFNTASRYLFREAVVYSTIDSQNSFRLKASCGLNDALTSYETYLIVETQETGLQLVRTYIDANDLFSDCSEGRGKIIDMELSAERNSVLVKFQNKGSIICPVFLAFEP